MKVDVKVRKLLKRRGEREDSIFTALELSNEQILQIVE